MLVTNIGLVTPVAAGSTGNSNAVNAMGMTRGSAGLTSDHAGTLSVQRYVDAGGQVPLGQALTEPVNAASSNSVAWADGLPCGSIVVSFINSAGAVANLTNISLNLAP